MPSSRLAKVDFSPDLLNRESVQGFDCGDESWEKEITDWLKAAPGEGGAVDHVTTGQSNVWLYLDGDHNLAGVGSLGPALLSWPKPSSNRVPAWCIPMLGVDRRYRRQGYGWEILDDLVAAARGMADNSPAVVLYVRVGNPAVNLYKKYGFIDHGKPRPDKEGQAIQRMVLRLS